MFMTSDQECLSFHEFEGTLSEGDLIELKEEMMLVSPSGPALVLKADNEKGFYEVMYTRNNYVLTVFRMDISRLLSKPERLTQ